MIDKTRSRYADQLGATKDYISENDENYLYGFIKEIPDEKIIECEKLLKSASVKDLITMGLLPNFEIRDAENRSKILFSPRVKYRPKYRSENLRSNDEFYPSNLPSQMILDAARAWIKINKLLLKDGLCLVDAHIFNFAFNENLYPVWVDFGSIREVDHGLEGILEFRAFYEYPLKSISRNSDLAQAYRYTFEHSGITRNAWRHLARIPIVSVRNFGSISAAIRILDLNSFFSEKVLPKISNSIRRIALTWLSLNLPSSIKSNGYWKTYSKRSLTKIPENDREIIIKDLIDTLIWESCVDIAGSDGKFILISKNVNKQFKLIDLEDAGLNKFVSHVKENNLATRNNSSYFVSLNSFEETQGTYDLVIALAITHHLVLSQWWTFNGLSEFFSQICNQHLIVEFMPNGVGKFQSPHKVLPEWYTEENFENSLFEYFDDVKKVGIVDSGNRVIYYAKKNPN